MSTPAWLVAKPIAHRGLHNKAQGIIENTLGAAEAAIAHGFPIECDVQLTGDGEVVVFHDFALERLTAESGLVADRSLAELSRMAITGSTKGDRIPSLPSFLSQIAKRVPLVIEIKSKFDKDLRLTTRVCEIMRDYHGPFVLKSFDPDIVEALRTLAPNISRGIIAELSYASKTDSLLAAALKHRLANLLHFNESKPQFISWKVQDLPCAPPFLCGLLGNLPVMTWTVRNPEDRARAEKHADQMVFEGFMP
ncbi:glycerophosphodiester phosphodiesterase family protein [Microvirga antarctica]|uniref:glycerophosphodiester phosphodiesterase family protein n=1 Tax=Microvirga antarctica TaxID=2819233 RepID=UPI001B316EE6|nr:glycerophosphodiester phosphodiesterase family protein [Microvirga antarctica]